MLTVLSAILEDDEVQDALEKQGVTPEGRDAVRGVVDLLAHVVPSGTAYKVAAAVIRFWTAEVKALSEKGTALDHVMAAHRLAEVVAGVGVLAKVIPKGTEQVIEAVQTMRGAGLALLQAAAEEDPTKQREANFNAAVGVGSVLGHDRATVPLVLRMLANLSTWFATPTPPVVAAEQPLPPAPETTTGPATTSEADLGQVPRPGPDASSQDRRRVPVGGTSLAARTGPAASPRVQGRVTEKRAALVRTLLRHAKAHFDDCFELLDPEVRERVADLLVRAQRALLGGRLDEAEALLDEAGILLAPVLA